MKTSRSDQKKLKQAKLFVSDAARRTKKAKRVADDVRSTMERKLAELRQAIADADVASVESLCESVEQLMRTHLGPPKSIVREYAESIGLAVVFALLLRGFVLEAFKIPTGSMIPTLLVGDHLFVNKFIYGIRVPFTQNFVVRFAEPKRGEVVVFTFPRGSAIAHLETKSARESGCIDEESLRVEKDFIKRIIAVAGDTVEVRDNKIFLNGKGLKRTYLGKKPVARHARHPFNIQEREQLDGHDYIIQFNGSRPNFPKITVKPNHVFVMGDSRDNSSDGRCWGQLPVENIKGRASIIWWSIGDPSIRWERLGSWIN